MNKYDERYEIRLAKIDDIENIMKFIEKYWKKNHILSIDRKLFEYEYLDGENVNFILAIERKTDLIQGIFGFIRCSNTKEYKKKQIWGSLWRINDECENIPFLGIELAKRACSMINCYNHIGNGANPNTTVPLRRLFFKDKVGKMKQYYYLNTNINEYNIANIKINIVPKYLENHKKIELVKFNSIDDIKDKFDLNSIKTIPYKDEWYINRRYFSHPYYNYDVYGIKNSNKKIEALIIMREIEYNNRKILRVIDYVGKQELFSYLGEKFNELMLENNYEYIDFYEFGFNDEYILKAGFKFRDDNDINIIPNYFEPFLQENIDIWVHYKDPNTLFFKGDGDQDRPNKPRL